MTKPQWNAENQGNWRVVIYLFRVDLPIDASVCPCPRAQESAAGCKTHFFSDG